MFGWVRSLFGKSQAPQASDEARALFIAEAEAILGELPQVAGVKRDEAAFALDITTAEGLTERAFLENHFFETREMSPEERRNRLRVAFSSVGKRDVSAKWDEAKEQLMPVLRGATFGVINAGAHFPGAPVAKPSSPLKRSFAPFIDVMVVIDSPTDMRYVSQSTVDDWKVSNDDVYEAAFANFRDRAELDAERYDDRHGPLFHVASGDSYEASRLLVPGWLASFRGKVEGDPVAIVPHRELLFVGGSARPEMIARLVTMADKEFEASPRRISSGLYTVDGDGKVIPYRSADEAVIIAHAKLAIFEYGQQQALLRESGEWNDWFVASYKVFSGDDGIIATASWTKDVPSLLPEVSFVTLVVLDDENAVVGEPVPVPWEKIVDRL